MLFIRVFRVALYPRPEGRGFTASLKNKKIIDGERRYRAAKIANITSIPYYIINDIPNNKIELVQLIANANRSDLSGLELAQSIKRIIDENVINQKDIAKLLNKQPSYVTRLMSMLSDEWIPLVQEGIISSPNTLEALKSLPKDKQNHLIEEARRNNTVIKHKDIKALKNNDTNSIENNIINKHDAQSATTFSKIKVNKKRLRDIVDYIDDSEEIEIIINEKLANDLRILIE
jgi:ParB family chromosome partitioning protein